MWQLGLLADLVTLAVQVAVAVSALPQDQSVVTQLEDTVICTVRTVAVVALVKGVVMVAMMGHVCNERKKLRLWQKYVIYEGQRNHVRALLPHPNPLLLEANY